MYGLFHTANSTLKWKIAFDTSNIYVTGAFHSSGVQALSALFSPLTNLTTRNSWSEPLSSVDEALVNQKEG